MKNKKLKGPRVYAYDVASVSAVMMFNVGESVMKQQEGFLSAVYVVSLWALNFVDVHKKRRTDWYGVSERTGIAWDTHAIVYAKKRMEQAGLDPNWKEAL